MHYKGCVPRRSARDTLGAAGTGVIMSNNRRMASDTTNDVRFMTQRKQSPARQAESKKECARKRRNAYRDLVIEYYARNSSSVLAITHRHWPDRAWTSQPELARIMSEETGVEWDYRSLSRQLRRVHRFDHAVRDRVFELLGDKALYAPDFRWETVCGRWGLVSARKVVSLSSELKEVWKRKN